MGNMETLHGSPEHPPVVHGEIVPAPLDDGTRAVSQVQQDPRNAVAGAWLLSARSVNTQTAYRRDLADFFDWCDRNAIDVCTARRFHVDAYRRYLENEVPTGRKTKGYAESTVARKLTAVSSFYRYGSREFSQLVPGNPAADVERPKVADESTTEGLTMEEAGRVLDAAAELGPMALALLEVFLGTALRVSELVNADADDLGNERGHVTLRTRRKGGARRRLVIPQEAATALAEYLDGRTTGPLFLMNGVRPSRQQAAYLVKKCARMAGVDKTISPHSLRHTAATIALDEGASLRDVQDMMVHADPRTTRRYDRSRNSIDRSASHTVGAALHRGRLQ